MAKKKRTIVIGLDGVPYTLIGRLIGEGITPNLARLDRLSPMKRMKVTLPEISMVSWSSFMTGVGPGTHGIFGFIDLKPNSYDLRFPSFKDLRAPTLWDRLGRMGKRSVVINQPATYPAQPLNGAMVSGFVALDLRKATYPQHYADALERLGYILDIDAMRAREDTTYLFKSLGESFMGRVAARDLWWDKEDWDYFQIVITGTDRLFHTRWDAVEDPSHPNHEDCVRYFKNIDRFIGKTFEKFGMICGRDTPEEGFFLLSDHGFCAIRQEVYLNSWLREEGYLGFSDPEPKGIEEITDDTRAFALDPSRIYIHARGRYPRGCVSPRDVPALKKEIAEKVKRLTCEGEPVIEEVHDAREIYEGDCVDLGPDLVAVGRHGFDLKGSVKEKKVFARTDLTGMHTWDDAFFWSADTGVENLNIVDICGILLGQFTG